MILLLIAFAGGVLTLLSPCILPVLPFVFARAGQPFLKSTLPMLLGMALTFAGIASLTAVGGEWALQANELGRAAALAALAIFGVALISPRVAAYFSAPAIALGNRLARTANGPESALNAGGSLLLGVATGLLWAPCAGPILGLILTGAAVNGANAQTTALLLAYAMGAATSLAVALLAGARVYAALKRTLGAAQVLRRGLGVAVLAAVTAIALGVDTGALAQVSYAGTAKLEQAVLGRLHRDEGDGKQTLAAVDDPAEGVGGVTPVLAAPYKSKLPVEGRLPSFDGAVQWLNSAPLTPAQLRGKVVLVDFWTYSCINCIRTTPYLRAWAQKYKDQGLVVIAVHTPEFAFEKKSANIKAAIEKFQIGYPVAVDSDFKIWRAFHNNYWPAFYFADAQGRIRHHNFGEGDYARSERVIQDLLAEAGSQADGRDIVAPHARGEEAAPDLRHIASNESYVGYEHASNFKSNESLRPDAPREYTAGRLGLNDWSLSGNWTVGAEPATLNRTGGSIAYRFKARDLHLVMGPGADGRAIGFQVTIDGKAPEASHGLDVDAQGSGTVTQTRLYQLVRQAGEIKERTFEIRFSDPGLHAYVFTFG